LPLWAIVRGIAPFHRLATLVANPKTQGYSKEKIVFQSFFMLITGQFFFFASA
jgi:hypothetical protein